MASYPYRLLNPEFVEAARTAPLARHVQARLVGYGSHPCRLAEWRRLLRQSVTQGRAVLQRILRGRIVFTPREGGYDFHCETRYDKLFTGLVVVRPKWMPEGSGPAFSPEDTWDSDYGRILVRLC